MIEDGADFQSARAFTLEVVAMREMRGRSH